MNKLEKGKALFEKQDYQKAITELTNFLLEEKNNADALYTRAICFRKVEDFEKSIADLSTILIRLPDEATLFCERGISHFHNKNITAAMEDMNKAVELDSDNPFRYSSRAYIRANVDVEGAMEDYQKAIKLDPEDAISYNNLGLLEENLGKMSSAKNRFRAADKIIGYHPEKRDIKDGKKIDPNDSFWKIILHIFIAKATRQEYLAYLKSFFKK